jgi:hypothetical protein
VFGRRDWTRTNDPHHVKAGHPRTNLVYINTMTTERDKRRDKIIKALEGVDLTVAHFTWSLPDLDDRGKYSVWVTVSNQSPTGHRVWSAATRKEALSVCDEMAELGRAARRLVS